MEREREIFEKVIQALEETPYSFRLEGVRAAVEKVASELGFSPGKVLDVAAKVLWTEERDRGLKALVGLWRALWNSDPPKEAVKALRRGGKVRVWHRGLLKLTKGEVAVEIEGERDFRLRCKGPPKDFHFSAWEEGARAVVASALKAEWGQAFLRAESLSKVKEVLKGTKRLLPLFSSMGLEGLERALEALLALEEGEARAEGPYVLAREKSFWVMRKGTLFGDPVSDGRFLLGGEVVLTYPGDVAVALRGKALSEGVWIREGYLRWGEEVVELKSQKSFNPLSKNLAGEVLRDALEGALPHANSARMRTLVEELKARRNPLKALEKEGFTERVKMRALARM